MPRTFRIHPAACFVALFLSFSLLTGCGVNSTAASGNMPLTSHIAGKVHGGQQPVKNATIQLYTVGISGDGSASTPMLSATVTTDASGFFDITGKYTCTSATYVYLVGTGGDPGIGSTNPNLAMMAALGPCSSLTPSTFITVNELTTVAAIYALAPYMTSITAIGSGSGDASALAAAFTLANQFVDTATGLSPGNNVPSNMSVPTALMNTLADIVASCINTSGGVAGDPSLCGQLFSLTTPGGGTAPTDTIAALLNLATHTDLNTDALFALAPPTAPFQPVLSMSPPAFLVRLTPSSSSGYVLQVAPSSLTFPSTPTSSASSAQTVVLENSGSSTITLSGLSFTGTNASDFGQTNTCGSTLATHASCSVQVKMTPSATGSRNAYFVVTSSSPDSPQYVTLSGTGSSPASGAVLQLSVRELASHVGTTQDVTITNAGGSPLTISGASNTTPYYSVINSCVSSVSPGGTCTISVTNLAQSYPQLPPYFYSYNPSGAFNAPGAVDAVTITSNDSAGPQTLLLRDGGGLSSLSAIGSSVDFSNAFFPQTVVSQSSSTTITAPISSLADVSITGTNAADFSKSSSCSTYYTQICAITVTFTPSATGTRTARLVVNTAGEYIPLQGSGVSSVPANQTLSPATASFVDLAGSQPVTLSNFAGTAISISSITVPSGFTQTNDCGSSLDASSICTITVSSTRTIQGGVQGLLIVAGDFGTLQTRLSALVHPIMQFGSGTVSQTSAVQPSLHSASFSDTIGAFFGASPSDFPNQGCNVHVPGGCGITLTATPVAVGLRTATLALSEANAGGSFTQQYLAEITGVSAGPNLSFGGPVYEQAKVGSNVILTFKVFNTGTTALTLAAPTFSGTDAARFTGSTTCATLATGGSCNVSVTFTPTQIGLATATLSITDSTSATAFTLPVSGLGEYVGVSIASVSPSNIFPATARYQESVPASFTITVPDGGPVTAALASTTNFYLSKASCAAGESPCIINVVFRPTVTASALTTTLTVTGDTASMSVQGDGGAGIASVSPDSLTFSDRATGTTSIAQTVALSNTGDLNIFVVSVSLTGTDAGQFILDNSCSGYVTPASSCNINVSFHPTVAGGKSASLYIQVNNTSGALPDITVPITGTAH